MVITAMRKEYISIKLRESCGGEKERCTAKSFRVGIEKEIWVEAEKKPQGKECSH